VSRDQYSSVGIFHPFSIYDMMICATRHKFQKKKGYLIYNKFLHSYVSIFLGGKWV
jgi:hypothetical protein